MLLVKSRADSLLFLKAFFSEVFLSLVAGAEEPASGLEVEIWVSPDVLIYSRREPAQGWIHEWSAAFTLTNTVTIIVGFLNAARRQLHPETRCTQISKLQIGTTGRLTMVVWVLGQTKGCPRRQTLQA